MDDRTRAYNPRKTIARISKNGYSFEPYIAQSAPVSSSRNAKMSSQAFSNIKTRALVVTEPKADFSMQTIYLDEVRPDEILIDMKFSGICHTVCIPHVCDQART